MQSNSTSREAAAETEPLPRAGSEKGLPISADCATLQQKGVIGHNDDLLAYLSAEAEHDAEKTDSYLAEKVGRSRGEARSV